MPATKYTPAIAGEIIRRISDGEALANICRDRKMPAVRTVNDWLHDNAGFAKEYEAARVLGADALAAQALLIAFTPQMGKETVKKGDGTTEVRISDMLGHRRLQVDTILKLLAKWFPQRYGDRVQLEHSGEIGAKTDREIDERIAELLTKFGTGAKAGRKPR